MFSQTVEYALRAMVFLTSSEGTPTSAQVIAAHVRVPERYMSKVMRSLVVAGLVRSRRGPTGGFVLARPADQISMLAVIESVDPLPRIEKCPLDNPKHSSLCPMHRRLDDAYQLIRRELGRSSLAEVSTDTGAESRCSMLSAQLPIYEQHIEGGSTPRGNGQADTPARGAATEHEHGPADSRHACRGGGTCGGSGQCGGKAYGALRR